MKRALEWKEKTFFIIFKELSVAKNCNRSRSQLNGKFLAETSVNYMPKFTQGWKLSYVHSEMQFHHKQNNKKLKHVVITDNYKPYFIKILFWLHLPITTFR